MKLYVINYNNGMSDESFAMQGLKECLRWLAAGNAAQSPYLHITDIWYMTPDRERQLSTWMLRAAQAYYNKYLTKELNALAEVEYNNQRYGSYAEQHKLRKSDLL